ncbi:general stress protein [Planomicrobium sp. CPCC 101079]|uniref:general stress protein n=1 Tax=Planomicrobium sp. CPCC 101079 TaxID=2599618 RepID=UPI0011B68BAF|nr:general stress protein [Planomicrobium sp. CPCC 101079]TWT13246.1 general stress protein [Planomicrobium sp. CPCC 101079]
MSQKRVVGSFNTENEAINAIEDLKRQGYNSEDISVLSKDKQETETVAGETDTNFVEGAATGATAGGALGGLGGVLAGMGALAIPGIGPIVAAGPVAAGLMGAAAGAGAGGLAGALIGMGVPDDEAEEYGRHFDEGRILVLAEEHGNSLADRSGSEDFRRDAHGGNDEDPAGTGLFGGRDRDAEGSGLFRRNDRDSTGPDAIIDNDLHDNSRDTSLGSDTDEIRKRGPAGL